MNDLRILMVEADPRESDRITNMLSDADHLVLPAANFEEASEALLVQRFDAVLLGATLPSAGIAPFIASLRQLEKKQNISTRTAVLSYSPANEQAAQIDAFLPEQFDSAQLIAAVERLAQSSVSTHTPAAETPDLPVFDADELRAQVAFDDEL